MFLCFLFFYIFYFLSENKSFFFTFENTNWYVWCIRRGKLSICRTQWFIINRYFIPEVALNWSKWDAWHGRQIWGRCHFDFQQSNFFILVSCGLIGRIHSGLKKNSFPVGKREHGVDSRQEAHLLLERPFQLLGRLALILLFKITGMLTQIHALTKTDIYGNKKWPQIFKKFI